MTLQFEGFLCADSHLAKHDHAGRTNRMSRAVRVAARRVVTLIIRSIPRKIKHVAEHISFNHGGEQTAAMVLQKKNEKQLENRGIMGTRIGAMCARFVWSAARAQSECGCKWCECECLCDCVYLPPNASHFRFTMSPSLYGPTTDARSTPNSSRMLMRSGGTIMHISRSRRRGAAAEKKCMRKMEKVFVERLRGK